MHGLCFVETIGYIGQYHAHYFVDIVHLESTSYCARSLTNKVFCERAILHLNRTTLAFILCHSTSVHARMYMCAHAYAGNTCKGVHSIMHVGTYLLLNYNQGKKTNKMN